MTIKTNQEKQNKETQAVSRNINKHQEQQETFRTNQETSINNQWKSREIIEHKGTSIKMKRILET